MDMAALRKALEAVTERHEMLRTSFLVQDDQPRQVIPSLPNVQLRMHTRQLRGSAASAVEALRDEQSREPDDLSKGPLFTLIALKVRLRQSLPHKLTLARRSCQARTWQVILCGW